MRKKHWAPNTDPTGGKISGKTLFRLACGLSAWIGSARDSGPRWHFSSASVFRDLSMANPDWYCCHCARAARLALAKESAPKPAVVVWPKPRPISEAWDTEILGYCPDIGWRRLSRIGQKWGLTGAEHIADYEPTHFLPLPPKPEVRD